MGERKIVNTLAPAASSHYQTGPTGRKTCLSIIQTCLKTLL
jgi:hypothetical protein